MYLWSFSPCPAPFFLPAAVHVLPRCCDNGSDGGQRGGDSGGGGGDDGGRGTDGCVGFFGGSGGVGGAKQIFLCNQRRTVARTVGGGALLTCDDLLAGDGRTDGRGRSLLPSLRASVS